MVSTLNKGNKTLTPDVWNFFANKKGSFGCMNLLPNHLPEKERAAELVKNVITVDFSTSCAYGILEYSHQVKRFCDRHFEFASHLAHLMSISKPMLADYFDKAVGATMDTVNIFSPKQCNLACKGCYTASKSVLVEPYAKDFVESYYSATKTVIAQARELGAKVIYTSGDGELTTFPRFFDLLEHVAENGMQWLFFTAGLIFSSEEAAQKAWQDIQEHASPATVKRLANNIRNYRLQKKQKPITKAFLNELARYRDHIQVYHSVWSTSDQINSQYRNPLIGNYEYVQENIRGIHLTLPSSVSDMLKFVFPGEYRERFGIQMPVGSFNLQDVLSMATYVANKEIKSYFEPIITTGRNKDNALESLSDEDLPYVSPLLVRELCSFRNVHQPTVKVSRTETGEARLFCSPGMGIDLKDLLAAGVSEKLEVKLQTDGLFAAVHSPLMVYANFSYSVGCKCNDFGIRLANDRESVWQEWREASAALNDVGISRAAIRERLRSISM